MTAHVVRPRRLLTGVVIVCVLAAALIAVAAPPPAASAPAQSVLVVRSAGGHDALWLLSPVDGTPTAAGDLPGKAAAVAVSPGGADAAYLPTKAGARLWIGWGPLGPKSISLEPAGVRRIDSFTWVDDHRLLVSGAAGAHARYEQDALYLVNVTTGKTSPFRGLHGVEPYGVPALGKVVYTRLAILKAGTAADNYARTVRESLRVVKVSRGKGSTIVSDTYTTELDHRTFAQPQLSQDGKWFVTGSTGSDVSVTYSVLGKWGYPLFNVFTAALDVKAGWTAAGLTAFAGMPSTSLGDESCVWVCDPARATLVCTTPGLLPHVMITDLAWSAAGDLVAGALSTGTKSPTRHVYVIPGSLTTANELGTGRLPVWVTP